MIFQRQECSSDNSIFIDDNANSSNERVQVEMMTAGNSMSLQNNSSSISNECFRYQSPTTSQTITTIASINRLSDDEMTSMSQSQDTTTTSSSSFSSSTMILDGRSLIKEMTKMNENIEGDNNWSRELENQNGYVNVINDNSDEKFNCNTIRSSNSRCTSEIHRSRNFSCNEENSVSIMDHNADVNQCKNVNSSINELNKTLTSLVHLSPSKSSSCETLKYDDRLLMNDDRCEIGVR
jgi:hypothetical protein